MLLNVALGIERAVLPYLPYADGGYGMLIVRLFHAGYSVVRYGAAVARNEVVQPFVVHCLMLRQVEHGVKHRVEVIGHVVLSLGLQLVVGDVFAQLRGTLHKLLFCVGACCK